MEEWKFAFQIAQFLLTGALGIYVHLVNKDKVNEDRIGAMEKAQNETNLSHSSRLAKLEANASSAVTHTHLSEVHVKVNEVSNCMSRLEGEFSGMARTLQLIHETLMEERRK